MCLLFRYQDRYRFGCSAHTRALASQSTRSAPADCPTVVWFPAPWAWCALKLMSAWRSQSSRSPYRSCGEISTAGRAVCGHGSRPAASDGKPNVRLVIATEGSTRPPACQASGASEGIVDALTARLDTCRPRVARRSRAARQVGPQDTCRPRAATPVQTARHVAGARTRKEVVSRWAGLDGVVRRNPCRPRAATSRPCSGI